MKIFGTKEKVFSSFTRSIGIAVVNRFMFAGLIILLLNFGDFLKYR